LRHNSRACARYSVIRFTAKGGIVLLNAIYY
jgi:hypothetical protein